MTIDQSAYIIETINEFNMASAKGRRTPRKLELQLSHHDAPKDEETYNEAQKLPYRKLVGKLMYLSQQSRPDISEATSASGKFFANWGTIHWNAAKDIVRYLRTSHLLPLVYHPKRKNSPLEIYVDAAYANDIDNRYSQTGIAIFYYDCLDWLGQPTPKIGDPEQLRSRVRRVDRRRKRSNPPPPSCRIYRQGLQP